ALYLQRYPTATWAVVKNDLLTCAMTDGFTGQNLPDNSWGYGKANGYNLVHGCLVSSEENELGGAALSCYPNPFSEQTTINYQLSNSSSKAELVITDMLGKEIRKEQLNQNSGKITL